MLLLFVIAFIISYTEGRLVLSSGLQAPKMLVEKDVLVLPRVHLERNKDGFKQAALKDSNCKCSGGSVKYYQYEDVPHSNAGSGCIGGCGGDPFAMHQYQTTIKTLRVWWGHSSEYDGFNAIQVQYFNGQQATIGKIPATGADSEFTFNAGEMLKGQAILCGNGIGTRTGYLSFETTTGRKFSAGKMHTPYYFNVDNTLLAGFFGQAKTEVDHLGIYLFKKVKKIELRNVDYPTLDSYMAGLTPKSIITRPFCNQSSKDQSESFTKSVSDGESMSWSLSTTESFDMTVNINVDAGIPEIAKVKENDTFHWGLSASQTFHMSQDTTTTVSETLNFIYPAYTKGTITYTQFDSKINVPWRGKELITFADGFVMGMDVEGEYKGVYVSKVTPIFDTHQCADNQCHCTGYFGKVYFDEK